MSWFILALTTAFFSAALGLEQKRLSDKATPLLLSVLLRLWALPPLLIIVLSVHPVWQVQPQYWGYLIMCSFFTGLAAYLAFLAYRLVDFTLAFPLLNFTPAIALLASWSINQDHPTLLGAIGVGLIVLGSFWLVSSRHHNTLTPLQRMSANKGIAAIMGVAALHAVSGSFDVHGIDASSPLLWTIGLTITILLGSSLVLLVTYKASERKSPKLHWYSAALGGSIVLMTMLFQFLAVHADGHVAYVLAIKQLSVILAVLASWYTVRERPSVTRLLSALVMTIGAIIIGLAH